MKKLVMFLVVLALIVVLFAGCGPQAQQPPAESEKPADTAKPAETAEEPGAEAPVSKGDIKIGVILVHDENSGYDAAHIDGIRAAAKATGIDEATQIIWKYNIPEDETTYDTAIDLVE
mgnify:FL=1